MRVTATTAIRDTDKKGIHAEAQGDGLFEVRIFPAGTPDKNVHMQMFAQFINTQGGCLEMASMEYDHNLWLWVYEVPA